MSEEEDDATDNAIIQMSDNHQTPQQNLHQTKPASLGSLAEQSPQQLDKQVKSRPKPAARKQKARGHDTKHQCQFVVGIEEESRFRVVRRIIGVAGANVKFIADQAGPETRLRLRGHGSKFFEGPHYQEAPEPLMLCVSVRNRTAYDIATGLVREQLERVYEEYDAFRESNGKQRLCLQVRMHEGPRAGSR